jgi:galactose mutarotase-like enzyme
MKISETITGGIRSLTLENERLRVVVLPDFGGKIISLRDLQHAYEWLSQGPLPTAEVLTHRQVGDRWTGREGWGWDECFPNIAAEKSGLYDHGEVWSRPWQFQAAENKLVGTVEGYGFNYLFERSLHLEDAALVATYRVTNRAAELLKVIWAMHSVFAAQTGMRIELPENITQLKVESGIAATPAKAGEMISWPLFKDPANEALDLSVIPSRDTAPFALKLFTPPLASNDGWLTFSGPGGTLKISFDPARMPFLGLWLNFGAWENAFEAALEPTLADSDALSTAVKEGRAVSLEPGASYGWEIRLAVD